MNQEEERKMTRRTFFHGHEAVFREDLDGWYYEDTGEKVGERPCPKCGEPPTPEGDDACIGHVEGVSGACCGHGQREPYVRFDLEFEGETDFELFQQAKKLAEHTGLDLNTYIKLAIGGHNEKIKYDLSR